MLKWNVALRNHEHKHDFFETNGVLSIQHFVCLSFGTMFAILQDMVLNVASFFDIGIQCLQ